MLALRMKNWCNYSGSLACFPTPVLLPGKSHGWRSLMGCSPWGHKESDTTERLHFHFSLSCIGEGNGNPLQCSCLENPRDGGAWWAAIYGVAQSRTWLKRLSSSSMFPVWMEMKTVLDMERDACSCLCHFQMSFWVRFHKNIFDIPYILGQPAISLWVSFYSSVMCALLLGTGVEQTERVPR